MEIETRPLVTLIRFAEVLAVKPGRVGEAEGIVQCVGISVPGLRVAHVIAQRECRK
jgi:hypothetical protein